MFRFYTGFSDREKLYWGRFLCVCILLLACMGLGNLVVTYTLWILDKRSGSELLASIAFALLSGQLLKDVGSWADPDTSAVRLTTLGAIAALSFI